MIGSNFIVGVTVLSSWTVYSGVSISFAVSVFSLVCTLRDLGKLEVELKVSIQYFTKAITEFLSTPIQSVLVPLPKQRRYVISYLSCAK